MRTVCLNHDRFIYFDARWVRIFSGARITTKQIDKNVTLIMLCALPISSAVRIPFYYFIFWFHWNEEENESNRLIRLCVTRKRNAHQSIPSSLTCTSDRDNDCSTHLQLPSVGSDSNCFYFFPCQAFSVISRVILYRCNEIPFRPNCGHWPHIKERLPFV